MSKRLFPSTAAIFLSALTFTGPAFAGANSIVLVHGMNVDGSGWRPVYDILVEKGYQVSIVQQPLNGFESDLRATQVAIDKLEGPVVLVGHSYGGVVVTTAGNDPKVEALVYVAAFQPAVGETTGSLNAAMPPLLDPAAVAITEDGYVSITRDGFVQDIAPDLPEADAHFLFASQTPTTSTVFMAETTDPAWEHKPSFAIVATQDRVVDPALQRMMAERAGSKTIEIKAGHLVYVSQPDAVAAVIVEAAEGIQ